MEQEINKIQRRTACKVREMINVENHSKKKTISIKHFSRNKMGTISIDKESR